MAGIETDTDLAIPLLHFGNGSQKQLCMFKYRCDVATKEMDKLCMHLELVKAKANVILE
jgi:hypothetical protein